MSKQIRTSELPDIDAAADCFKSPTGSNVDKGNVNVKGSKRCSALPEIKEIRSTNESMVKEEAGKFLSKERTRNSRISDGSNGKRESINKVRTSGVLARTNSCNNTSKTDPFKKIFDELKEDRDSLTIKKLFDLIMSRGICPNEDLRLSEVRKELEQIYKGRHLNDIVINFEMFKQLCEPVSGFILKVLENKLAIQQVDEWIRCLSMYYDGIKTMTGKDFGISLTSADGQKIQWGDVKRSFPLNELIHVVTYCMSLETLGFIRVHEVVGLEPKPNSEWSPGNPLMGAGALAVIANLMNFTFGKMNAAERHESIKKLISHLCAEADVLFDSKTFVSSERKSQYLKAILSWIIADENIGVLCRDVDKVVQFYLECSSLQIDVEALSVMGATLANGGICATTGLKVLCCECVEKVLSVMTISSCKPGIPVVASSSGAVLVVVPGMLSLAIHSDDPSVSTYFLSAIFRHFALNPYERVFLGIERSKKDCICLKPALFNSARNGDILSLCSLLFIGVPLNSRDYLSRTVLHVAAAHGHLTYIKFLIKYCPMMVCSTDVMGRSPLDEAVFFQHNDVEEFLANWEAVSQGSRRSTLKSKRESIN